MCKKNSQKIISSFILIFLVSGCAPKNDYFSYQDKNGKGAKVFNKDLQVCQNYSNKSARQIEGSKGAGERFNHKNSIFLLCMKNKDWVLRE
jgi:hypothetical protein